VKDGRDSGFFFPTFHFNIPIFPAGARIGYDIKCTIYGRNTVNGRFQLRESNLRVSSSFYSGRKRGVNGVNIFPTVVSRITEIVYGHFFSQSICSNLRNTLVFLLTEDSLLLTLLLRTHLLDDYLIVYASYREWLPNSPPVPRRK
jgi:hypothetical protein